MEHIVQFAIGIDDEAIRQRIKETGYEQVIRNLVDRAEKSIADRQWNRDGKVNWERLVESAVKRFGGITMTEKHAKIITIFIFGIILLELTYMLSMV